MRLILNSIIAVNLEYQNNQLISQQNMVQINKCNASFLKKITKLLKFFTDFKIKRMKSTKIARTDMILHNKYTINRYYAWIQKESFLTDNILISYTIYGTVEKGDHKYTYYSLKYVCTTYHYKGITTKSLIQKKIHNCCIFSNIKFTFSAGLYHSTDSETENQAGPHKLICVHLAMLKFSFKF